MEECWKQDCPNWAGYLRNNCRAWWTELAKNCKDYLKAKTESGAQVPCTVGLVCPSCGWDGSELKKEGCLTDADEWYVCPGCGLDGSKMRRAD